MSGFRQRHYVILGSERRRATKDLAEGRIIRTTGTTEERI